MDPGHHTVFLLAILICILLLLLAVSALLMCYWRRKGFKITNRQSSIRHGGPMKDQATSMASFTWNVTDPKLHIYSGLKVSQAFSVPITVDQTSQKGKHLFSRLSLDSHILSFSDDEEGSQTSELVSKSVRKKSEISGQYLALQSMLSSGASVLGNVLERSSMFSLKAKRRSSSLKSGVDSDMLMAPLESPVHISSLAAGQFQARSLPRNLSRSSTLLCENSSDQQFTWDTAGLSIISSHAAHKESCSVPSTLQRKSCISDEDYKKQSTVQLQNSDFLRPNAWFVSMGNRPISDGAPVEQKDLNNVTSLDSGVDIIEVPVRTLNSLPKPTSTGDTESHVPTRNLSEYSEINRENEIQEVEPAQEEFKELYISRQEAARKLNPGNHGRSLWE